MPVHIRSWKKLCSDVCFNIFWLVWNNCWELPTSFPESSDQNKLGKWSLKHWTTSFHGFCNILMNICLVFKILNGLAAPPLPLHFISFCPWESLQSTRISSTKDRTVAFCHSAFGRSALSAKAWTQWKLKSCLIPLGTAALSPALLKYLLKGSDL